MLTSIIVYYVRIKGYLVFVDLVSIVLVMLSKQICYKIDQKVSQKVSSNLDQIHHLNHKVEKHLHKLTSIEYLVLSWNQANN